MNLFVTLEGKRVNVKEITSESKPYPFSTKFHELDRMMLVLDIAANERNISALKRMPKSKTSTEDIEKLTNDSIQKNAEIKHRNDQEKLHNLRRGSSN